MNKINAITKACAINDTIFKELTDTFCFKTEKEIEQFILKRFKQHNVKPSYPPIVANNNANIHPKPRKKKLERGFIVLDFACTYKGWCSDMTRMLFVGTPTKHEKKVYNLVLACQQKCVNKVKPGTRVADLDLYARSLLGKYKPYFKHSLGHGIGRKIHEQPKISIFSDEIIKKNDVITIEPGIYVKHKKKEMGIRVEDTIVVGRKNKILTKSTKKLVQVKL